MELYKNNCCKEFTELLQRNFMLKAMGYSSQQIVMALTARGFTTNEIAIVKQGVRINCFYRNAKGEGCACLSISKAWQSGDMPRLMQKYSEEFRHEIEAFEKPNNIRFVNLPEIIKK
jgi:hypothetical protein